MKKEDKQRILSGIKLVLTDLDGCLTDGGMYYNEEKMIFKKFNVKDGMGNRLLQEAGIKTGIITTDASEIVKARGEKLKIDFIATGIWDKHITAQQICDELGITLKEVAFMGDDVNDMKLLELVGYSVCPTDAIDEVKEIVHDVLGKDGGKGAFRELADKILKAKKLSESL